LNKFAEGNGMAGNALVEGFLRPNSMVPHRRTQNLNSARTQNIVSILFHDNFLKICGKYGKITSKGRTFVTCRKSGVTYGFTNKPFTDTVGGKIAKLVTVINMENLFPSGNALN
jgi:hypothetical protein